MKRKKIYIIINQVIKKIKVIIVLMITVKKKMK